MEELRAALWAFLDKPPQERWEEMLDRVRAALAPITDGDALHALAREYRAEAERRGEYALAHSPLYPWGVVNYLDNQADGLRYQAEKHDGPCNCALVTRLELPKYVDKTDFVQIGESEDYYDPWKDFECPHCKAVWRQYDNSSEQYSAWSWSLIRAGGGW